MTENSYSRTFLPHGNTFGMVLARCKNVRTMGGYQTRAGVLNRILTFWLQGIGTYLEVQLYYTIQCKFSCRVSYHFNMLTTSLCLLSFFINIVHF
jgi:hypothetical protein